jgi:hypothetical protein
LGTSLEIDPRGEEIAFVVDPLGSFADSAEMAGVANADDANAGTSSGFEQFFDRSPAGYLAERGPSIDLGERAGVLDNRGTGRLEGSPPRPGWRSTEV